jgi:plastocyanin
MKKLLLLALASLFICVLHATTLTIQVSNNQFNPQNPNAHVGDTIVWTWVEGGHTTTSQSIPAGAEPWDTAMDENHTRFAYRLTKAGIYNYQCIFHVGMTGIINVSEILPVTLTAFNVTASGTNANIQWRTVNERNIANYTIKRSSDGINFTDIGQVKADNKTSSNTYSFTDKTIPDNDQYVYYFIDILDKDNSRTSSAIQSFKNVFAKAGLLHQLFPNPVSGTDHLMLQFYADKPGKLLVQLFDASGALVKQAQMSAVVGLNNGHFHTGALAAGTYVLQCTLDDKKETRQIIVQ